MTKEQISTKNTDLLNGAPFPSFIVDKSGQLVDWNDSIYKLFGYTAEDVTSLATLPITDTLFTSVNEELWQAISDSEQPLRFENLQLTTKNGQLVSVTMFTKPVTHADQQAIYIVCLPTGSVRSFDNEQQLLIDLKNGIQSSFMMVTLDNEGFILSSNQHFLKTSNWTPKRVIGKTLWQLFPKTEEGTKIVQAIWKTLKSGQIWQGEVEKANKR